LVRPRVGLRATDNHTRRPDVEQSQSIAALAAALAKAQSELKPAPKDSENPFFKSSYADLATVSKTAFPVLSKHGLSVSQVAEGEGGITTILMHTSGEWLKGTLTLKPVKADPQGIGSAITYARRYALASICGLATEDDDGNAATHTKPEPKEPEGPPKLSDEQVHIVDGFSEGINQATTLEELEAISARLKTEKATIPDYYVDKLRGRFTARKNAIKGGK
jgi:hypothetical protein